MSSTIGKLIVVEGLEGAGKSTAIQALIDVLNKKNITFLVTREPGGTAIGEVLRGVIKNPEYTGVIQDKTELLLLYASRIQLITEVIKPALAQGTWIIADRFELSTLAYQGGGRGIDMQMIKNLSAFCLNGFKPDLTLYLDISPEIGMHRAKQRGQFDRIEKQEIDFFHKVHQAYLQCISEDPKIISINASLSLEEVIAAIQKVLIQFIEH